MFICHNGEFVKEDDKIFHSKNRAFRYGDGLFESLRWHNGQALFIEDHIRRLMRGMFYLHIEVHQNFTIDFFRKLFWQLISMNNIQMPARIRLQVFRDSGGFYLPSSNKSNFLIEVKTLERQIYKFNETGLVMGLFEKEKKSCSMLSNFKTSNSLIFVLASVCAKKNGWNDCFILNHRDTICDTINSNIFIVKKDMLITPPLSDGCLDGVMRKQVFKLAHEMKLQVNEQSLSPDDLLKAEEVFITNVIQGIRWVESFDGKNYNHSVSRQMNAALVNKFS